MNHPRTAFDGIIEALPTLALYVPSSPFLAEASESVDKCAAVCAMNARCLSFSFYIRTFTFCHLYTEAPSVSAYEGGAAPDPVAPDPRVHIIGLPPHYTCDSRTYRKRAWCRAEIMSCWARNGTMSMYVSTNQGLRSLATNDSVLLEALDVFDGDLTCCHHKHNRGDVCDKEALMLPMLGLYADLYKERKGMASEAYNNYTAQVGTGRTLTNLGSLITLCS